MHFAVAKEEEAVGKIARGSKTYRDLAMGLTLSLAHKNRSKAHLKLASSVGPRKLH